MADQKISALTEATTLDGTEDFPLVQTSTKRCGIDTLFSTANAVWQGWTMRTTALTSTSWDGDAYSTTAKTLIDLSAVFSVPAGVTAILAEVTIRDSGSSGTNDCYFILSPNNTAASGPMIVRIGGVTNDYHRTQCEIVPCDANGDVYWQCAASGASTMDVIIRIWGYLVG